MQRVLDLGGIDVHAARDDHVPLAIADVDEALVVHPRDVPDGHPLAARGLRRRGRIAIVLVEHAVVATHEELARRARGHRTALVVEDHELDAGRGATAGARLAQNVLGAKHGVHAELGRAVELVEHRTEQREGLLLHAHRTRRRGDDERAHRRHVVTRADLRRQIDDTLEQRGRHERRRAAMALDLPQGILGIELSHHHDGAADHLRIERKAAGRRVIERTGDEMHLVGIGAVQCDQARQHRARIDHAAERALGLAGGAGRVNHRAAQGRGR